MNNIVIEFTDQEISEFLDALIDAMQELRAENGRTFTVRSLEDLFDMLSRH
jgi:glycine cleavage system protein P-like pyridoxal-binding family